MPAEPSPSRLPSLCPNSDAWGYSSSSAWSTSRLRFARIIAESDTSASFADIDEMNWVIDLNGRRIIVHREPAAGVYKSVVAYNENEQVASIAAPGQSLSVRDVLN